MARVAERGDLMGRKIRHGIARVIRAGIFIAEIVLTVWGIVILTLMLIADPMWWVWFALWIGVAILAFIAGANLLYWLEK